MKYSAWNDIENGLPPAGVPLIVTVVSDSYTNGAKLCYPVIYRKSFIRDRWGFYEHGMEDGIIGPDYFKVTAWMRLPTPYTGPERETGWISVEEKLPEKGLETWVYAIPPAHRLDLSPEVDIDTYEGNRGSKEYWFNPDPGESREFIASGWYTYSGWNVTHWMPIVKPEPPEA